MKAGTLEIDLVANMARLQKDMNRATGVVGSAMGSISKMVDAAKLTLGGLSGAFAINEFVRMADAMQTVQARIKLVTAGSADLSAVQAQLVRVSKQNQVGLTETANAYAKLSRPLRSLGSDTQAVIDVTDAFGKALRIGGANTQEATAATQQFAQAMASGVLRGDEFNSIAEASPRIMQAIAEGSGLAEGALRDLASEGKLTAGIVGGALLKEMTLLEAEAAQIPRTVSGTFTNFKTDLMVVAGELNNATAITGVFRAGLETASAVVRALGSGAVATFGTVTRLIDQHRGVVEAATFAVIALGGAYAGLRAAMLVTTAISAATTAITAMSAATLALRLGFVAMATTMGTLPALFAVVRTAALGLYAALGPIGWTMAAIGAASAVAVGIYAKHATATDKARQSAADFAGELARVKEQQDALAKGPAGTAALERKDAMREYQKSLLQKGYSVVQIGQLMDAQRKLQASRDQAAARMEAESARQVKLQLDQAKAAKDAKKAETEQQQEAKKAAADRERMAKARRDFDADTAGLYEQMKLLRDGLTIEEARLTVEHRRAGMSQQQIDQRIAAEQGLNLILAAREDMARRMGETKFGVDYGPLRDFDGMLKGNLGDLDAANDKLQKFRDTAVQIDLDGVFGRAGKGLASLVNVFEQFARQQHEYRDAIRSGSGSEADHAIARRKQFRLDIQNYGTMAGAAKQFFKENSAGYKALYTAEKAFRAVELALAIKNAATKIGLIGATTTAKVASDTTMSASDTVRAGIEQGNSLASTAVKAVEAVVNAMRTLPPPLNIAAGAAMAGVIASLGIAVGGAFGGGGSGRPTYNAGKGTVLGDSDAQSESIAKSLEHLRDIDTLTMKYSSQMAASLKNIEANIGGLASLIVRTGNVEASGAGVQTGTVGGLSSLMATGTGPIGALIGSAVSKIPIVGGLLNGVAKALFGTKTSIVGQGIMAGPQSLADILGGGFDASYFTDVQKKKKTFGITTSTKYSTQTTAADDELEAQFGLVLRGFYDALGAAAVPLGATLDGIQGQLSSFVVDLGRINLQGKTGQEIQDELVAVFGAAGDQMAQAAFPGLQSFQKVGEGYLETVIRVSSSVEAMGNALDMLGRSANLGVTTTMALVDAFGDAATMQSVVGDYFSAFYTDAERAAAQTAQLSRAMEGLGLTLPGSTAAFRALVDAQDLTSAAGQQIYVTLMRLAPMFADVFGTAQDAIEALVGPSRTAADIAKERLGLENQLLELQGNTAELRRRELEALDPSNRALQEQIWAADAAKQLKDAWTSIAEGLLSEVQRIRGVMGVSGGGYASLLAQFNSATAAARGGDQDAARSLTGLSQSLLTAASDMASSQADLARIQGTIAASLEQTAGMGGSFSSAGDIGALLGSAGASDKPTWWDSFIQGQVAGAQAAANDSATVSELRQLRTQVAQLIEDQRIGHVAIASNINSTNKRLDRVTPDGDAFAVREVAA